MISVVIPTFEEAAHLPGTLASLRKNSEPHEILVVDARSSDATPSIAAKFGTGILISNFRQRAAQMNAGAASARGDVLLFLHADTRLPERGLERIGSALSNPKIVGGGFARRYDSPSTFLRVSCALAEIRTRCFGWFLGDQAMFVRRSVFEQLGGFPKWDIFEDLEFSRRLRRVGQVVTLRPPVLSAARRFQTKGAWRTTWNDLCLTARYLRGRHPVVTKSGNQKSNSAIVAFPR